MHFDKMCLLMHEQLECLLREKNLSKDVFELVNKSLQKD